MKSSSCHKWFSAVFALIAVAHLYHLGMYPRFQNPNARSRIYMTLAIAEHGSLEIDPYVETYGPSDDMAVHNGRTYSDKAPGLSLWLVPFAWVLRHTFFAAPEFFGFRIALRVLGLTLPALAFWYFMRSYFSEIAGSPRAGLAVIVAGALGTNFLVYSTTLFGHVPAAILLTLSFLSIRRLRDGPASGVLSFVGGLLLGLSFITDYVVMFAVALLGLYALWINRKRPSWAGLYCLGVAMPLLCWMALNNASYGSPLTVGFHLSVNDQFRQGYARGVAGIQPPNLEALWDMWFSRSRGMFFLSPFLALAPFGFVRLWRETRFRADVVLALAIIVALSLFTSTTLDWKGGWAVGMRYMVPAVPFLLIGVAGCCRSSERSTHVIFAALALPALFLTGASEATFPYFPGEIVDPLYNMALPLAARSLVGSNILTVLGFDGGIYPWLVIILLAAGCVVGLLRGSLIGVAIAAVLVFGQWQTRPNLSEPENAAIGACLRYMGLR